MVVTMEQRIPYSPETEEKLKPVIYGAIESKGRLRSSRSMAETE